MVNQPFNTLLCFNKIILFYKANKSFLIKLFNLTGSRPYWGFKMYSISSLKVYLIETAMAWNIPN